MPGPQLTVSDTGQDATGAHAAQYRVITVHTTCSRGGAAGRQVAGMACSHPEAVSFAWAVANVTATLRRR